MFCAICTRGLCTFPNVTCSPSFHLNYGKPLGRLTLIMWSKWAECALWHFISKFPGDIKYYRKYKTGAYPGNTKHLKSVIDHRKSKRKKTRAGNFERGLPGREKIYEQTKRVQEDHSDRNGCRNGGFSCCDRSWRQNGAG